MPTSAAASPGASIDAVPDLGDDLTLALELTHNPLLVLRKQLGPRLDAKYPRNRGSHAPIVTGDHQGGYSLAAERLDASLSVRPGLVPHRDQSGHLTSGEEHRDSLAFVVQGTNARLQVVGDHRSFAGGLRGAEE